jgi:hypothetical protein
MIQRRPVLVYQHQYEESNPTKYRVMKELFWNWATDDATRQPAQTKAH